MPGDWDGDGDDTLGVHAGGRWWLRNDLSCCNAAIIYDFGVIDPDQVLLSGDWNGDGVDTPGIYSTSNKRWYLLNGLGGTHYDIGPIPYAVVSNAAQPVVGDWDGNGTDTPGPVRQRYVVPAQRPGGRQCSDHLHVCPERHRRQGLLGRLERRRRRDTPGFFVDGRWYLTNTFGPTGWFYVDYNLAITTGMVPIVGDLG